MSRLVDWLDRRTGLRQLLREALGEPIPGGARLAYVFGSGLLFVFLSQVITGVFLALYYVPSADHAHVTVAYIVKEVASGSFLRSLHAYGSSAMIIIVLLHMAQTLVYGSYKGAREILWVAGCVLFALVLGMAFTGYLLPWDQKAYFATAIGTNILGEVPLIGEWLQRLVRGGADMGTLTVSRFFVAHVFLIPAAIFAFVGLHVFLFRKAGPAGPPSVEAARRRTELFYPRQVLMDVGFAMTIIVCLGVVAWMWPAELGPEANAADTRFLPRPEWYYVPVFQWLKYWKGSSAVIGIVIIPALLAVFFVGLPFFDRSPERSPLKRPVTVGAFAAVLLSLALLGVLSVLEDRRDPAIAQQLTAQREADRRYTAEPFAPEESPASLKTAKAALVDPALSRGKAVYEAQSCDACHGDAGQGTPGAPALIGLAAKYPGEEMSRILRMPTAKMTDGGMMPLDISDDDLKVLVAYMNALK
ncbi:MAG: cytochrome b N-terminal domain-containing protein [Vicinamibacterales bacterium]